MRRRRSTPWIYRWSRPLIGAIAIIGAILTAYLTLVKLSGAEVICSSEAASSAAGCNSVLTSDYASILGLPLSLFGFLAYASMAIFALFPLVVDRENNRKLKSQLDDWTWLLLLVGGTAMTVFSGYLMYLLASELKTLCPYCIASALFSLSLFLLTIVGREWEDIWQILTTGGIVAVVTLVATLGLFSTNGSAIADSGRTPIPQISANPQAPYGWEITTTSGEAEIALAKHLTEIGAKEYGAYWCPHCYDQKQLFGKEAFKEVNYIECDPNGSNPQRELCLQAGIEGFPTWEINGELYSGTQSLEKLAQLSGYEGPTNFRYTNTN